MTEKDPKIAIAYQAILSRFGKPEGEMNVDLFVSHHKEEVDAEEWKSCLGDNNPSDQAILACLVFKDCWDSKEDGVPDTYDFTLPDDLTQYVLSVRFDGEEVESVDMES